MNRYVGVRFPNGNGTIYTYLANKILKKKVVGLKVMVPVGTSSTKKEAEIVFDTDCSPQGVKNTELRLSKQNLLNKLKSVSQEDLIL